MEFHDQNHDQNREIEELQAKIEELRATAQRGQSVVEEYRRECYALIESIKALKAKRDALTKTVAELELRTSAKEAFAIEGFKRPVWKQWWFYLAVVGIVAAVIILIVTSGGKPTIYATPDPSTVLTTTITPAPFPAATAAKTPEPTIDSKIRMLQAPDMTRAQIEKVCQQTSETLKGYARVNSVSVKLGDTGYDIAFKIEISHEFTKSELWELMSSALKLFNGFARLIDQSIVEQEENNAYYGGFFDHYDAWIAIITENDREEVQYYKLAKGMHAIVSMSA